MAPSISEAARFPLHERARFPRGFRCMSSNIGLKKEGTDLALFASEVPGCAAAIFTRNQFPGAPVLVGRELLKPGRLQAVVVNSKISNVGTGAQGIRNARRMGAAAARELDISEDLVLMSSTGVIAVQLPIERIEAGLQGAAKQLQDDPLVGAEGIMTTDSHPKALSVSCGEATLTIVAKGAGMVEPDMATMLAYIFTDADIASARLDRMLRRAAHVSFNMLSIDSDTSTSDTCVIIANGLAGRVNEEDFYAALERICVRMAEVLARDGEGATKLLRVKVNGALTEAEARIIAKSLVNSPLIKTMAYGADPNVGRILMAVGKCFDCTIDHSTFRAATNGITVFANGARQEYDEAELRRELAGDPVDVFVELGVGDGEATAFGCDLTAGYIEENAAYFSS